MKKHANIPLFIPHLGCPNRCVFCNQHTISGTVCFRKESVCTQIETALATIPRDMPCEIAFFGGSFTGIDRDLMVYLLNLATSYVYAGRVRAIRFSTRPDYITPEIVRILARYPIGMAELGIQSMSDRVLAACDRGHTAADTVTACGLLRDAGIPYGGQMMLGLPESTAEDERECAAAIAALGCTESRIYPTIVFRDTPLAALWEGGMYRPLSLEEAVERAADAEEIFHTNGVRTLRIGLCDSENLHGVDCLAGPVHPAMGELVASRIYLHRIEDALERLPHGIPEKVTVVVPKGDISMVVGQKKTNTLRIKNKYNVKSLHFLENPALIRYNILLGSL